MSHKRQSGKSMGKVAVIDLTLDSDANPSPDSDSDIEILPSKKRAKSSTSQAIKPSPTKHLKHIQPDSSSTKNHRVAHHSGAGAAAQIAGSSEQGVSEVDGSEMVKAKKDAELDKIDKTRKAVEFADEVEEARRLGKEAVALEKADKKTTGAEKNPRKGGDGIVYLSVMDDKGQLLEGDDDGDNLRHLAEIKEIFPAGTECKIGNVSTYSIIPGFGFPGVNLQLLQIKTVTHFINHTLLCRFEAAKEALRAAGRSTEEVMIFHGTPSANIPSIMKNGFRIGPSGGGIWLARNPHLSVYYCRGGTKMFACRVLPGKFETALNRGIGEGDSFSGSGYDDSIFVLPIYVIEFTWSLNQQPPEPEEQYRAIFDAAGFGDFF
ncbi:hypothetical protein RQP46_008728 [Phenoliferia psychrophenolica]